MLHYEQPSRRHDPRADYVQPAFLFSFQEDDMTPEVLSLVAGIVLSLMFSYIPKMNTWYAVQSEEVKKLIMLGLLLVVAAAVYGLSCAGYLPEAYAVACGEQGIVVLVQAFILAAVANQTAYKLTPQLRAVKDAKLSLMNPQATTYPKTG